MNEEERARYDELRSMRHADLPAGVGNIKDKLFLSEEQKDRAVGAVLVSAIGDALGSDYEFGDPLPDDEEIQFGEGFFRHGVGVWTDDTEMAMPIFKAVVRRKNLQDANTLAEIVGAWKEWSETAKDVGLQTGVVLGNMPENPSEEEARAAAEARFKEKPGDGNGSLMRTGPLALAYLRNTASANQELAEAARRISELTHWGDDSGDACVLWSVMIRQGIRDGAIDPIGATKFLAPEKQKLWTDRIMEALEPGRPITDFSMNKVGWVVTSFQAALNAVMTTKTGRDAIEKAIRGGGDADTVAAIAGSLAGAIHGTASIPEEWINRVHGFPETSAREIKEELIAFLEK